MTISTTFTWMKHVAYYLRVSSKAQDTASQELDLKRHAQGQDDESVWYTDTFSGKSMDRNGWNRLMEAVRQGKVPRSSAGVWIA